MSRFPDFNKWHKVPQDATIPAGTPCWRYVNEEDEGRYYGQGLDYNIGLAERWSDDDYYTEKSILSPEEEKIEKRARDMYYSVGGTGWEYIGEHDQEAWLNLARKYVEKEEEED